MISKHPTQTHDFTDALNCAIKGENIVIINMLLRHGGELSYIALAKAVHTGNHDILNLICVKYLEQKKTTEEHIIAGTVAILAAEEKKDTKSRLILQTYGYKTDEAMIKRCASNCTCKSCQGKKAQNNILRERLAQQPHTSAKRLKAILEHLTKKVISSRGISSHENKQALLDYLETMTIENDTTEPDLLRTIKDKLKELFDEPTITQINNLLDKSKVDATKAASAVHQRHHALPRTEKSPAAQAAELRAAAAQAAKMQAGAAAEGGGAGAAAEMQAAEETRAAAAQAAEMQAGAAAAQAAAAMQAAAGGGAVVAAEMQAAEETREAAEMQAGAAAAQAAAAMQAAAGGGAGAAAAAEETREAAAPPKQPPTLVVAHKPIVTRLIIPAESKFDDFDYLNSLYEEVKATTDKFVILGFFFLLTKISFIHGYDTDEASLGLSKHYLDAANLGIFLTQPNADEALTMSMQLWFNQMQERIKELSEQTPEFESVVHNDTLRNAKTTDCSGTDKHKLANIARTMLLHTGKNGAGASKQETLRRNTLSHATHAQRITGCSIQTYLTVCSDIADGTSPISPIEGENFTALYNNCAHAAAPGAKLS